MLSQLEVSEVVTCRIMSIFTQKFEKLVARSCMLSLAGRHGDFFAAAVRLANNTVACNSRTVLFQKLSSQTLLLL